MSRIEEYEEIKYDLLSDSPFLPRCPSRQSPDRKQQATAAIASFQLHPTIEAILHLLNGDLPSAHYLVRHMQGPIPLNDVQAYANRNPLKLNPARYPGRQPRRSPRFILPVVHEATALEKLDNPEDQREQLGGRAWLDKAPKVEGMHIHAILHRLEGDYNNALGWYRDLSSASSAALRVEGGESVFTYTFPTLPLDTAMNLVRDMRSLEMRQCSQRRRVQLIKQLGMDTSRAVIKGWNFAYERDYERLRRESKAEISSVLDWCERRYGLDAWPDASGEFVRPSEISPKHSELVKRQIMGGEGWRQF